MTLEEPVTLRRRPAGAAQALVRRASPLLLLSGLALALSGDAAPHRVSAASVSDPLVLSLLLLLAGGVLSGLLAGLLGIGGAIVTLPVLHAALPALGVDDVRLSATAVATALVAMLPITLIAACRQHRHGALEIGWLRRMAGPMACGAACGALIAAALNGPVLAAMFALQSSWYGTRLLLRRGDIAPVACRGGLLQHFARWPTWIAAPPMAAFCACVGMGGGSIVTPFLLRQGMPFRHAVATAAALNVCISLGGSAAFAVSGAGGVTACVPAAAVLSVGAMASVSFGVSLAHRVPAVLLQRLVGLVNLASAATLFWQIGVH